MRKKALIVISFVAMVLAACAFGGNETAAVSFDTAGGMASEAPAEASFGDQLSLANTDLKAMTQSSTQSQNDASTTSIQQPLIIRDGQLELVVEDVDASAAEISDLVESFEGWVVSTSVRQIGAYRRGTVRVRVPVADFDTSMQVIKELALEVQSESTSGQDVTEEYVDVAARLGNLEATADRVRSFLQQASNVEEALAVNAELSRLEAEIESLKGRLNYLSQSAAFSTIDVELIPDEASQPIEIGGWRPAGVAKDALETLVSALQGLANVAIYLILLIAPIALLIIAPIYFVGRFIFRRIRRRRAGIPGPDQAES